MYLALGIYGLQVPSEGPALQVLSQLVPPGLLNDMPIFVEQYDYLDKSPFSAFRAPGLIEK